MDLGRPPGSRGSTLGEASTARWRLALYMFETPIPVKGAEVRIIRMLHVAPVRWWGDEEVWHLRVQPGSSHSNPPPESESPSRLTIAGSVSVFVLILDKYGWMDGRM